MTKNDILSQISQQEVFLKFLKLQQFPNNNISSPFTADKNPSFKLYKNGTYKCFSTGKQGDCFQLVADLNQLDCQTQFHEILKLITKECNLETNHGHFNYTPKKLEEKHLSYWNQNNWNVTPEILKKYNVQALDKFEYWNSSKEKITKIKLFPGVIGFIYPVGSNVELYIPKQEKNKKFFYNQLSQNNIFGLEQIPDQCDHIIIAAGKKDCLILNANGFHSISFRSENHYITPEQIDLLKARTNNLFICYDNDEPGQKAQSRAAEKHGLTPIHLPQEYNDIADYFQAYQKEDFQEIFKEAQEVREANQEDRTKGTTIFHETEEYLDKFYKFRYNEVALDIECCKKGTTNWQSLNENSLFIELQKKGIKCSINNLLAILKSDFVPHYNPLKHYFNSLPKWDGKIDYIAQLCRYVNTKDEEQFVYHFRKWCVRTVKCVYNESYFNKQAFVLVHKGQSSGKSTWCRFLCPPALSKYIAEDISNDKDARILLCKNFLINLDELAVLSRKEINSLKSYFSKTVVNERLPYDRKNSILPRVCSFIGSTNMTSFLNDETGSVRWLCFELTGQINFKYSEEININNLWSQALALANSNFDCELSLEDIKANEDRNSMYSILSTEQEMISKYFEHPTNGQSEFMTATDVLVHLQPLGIRLNKVQIGKALSALGYDKIKHSGRGVYGYYVNPHALFPAPVSQYQTPDEEFFNEMRKRRAQKIK
ncbi:MAG: VapE domain-containing protein [Flavobacteriaceae bacterium]